MAVDHQKLLLRKNYQFKGPEPSACIPPVRVMLNGLGVNLTAAHVFDSQWQPLSVLGLSITHGLQVGLLYFTVFSPDDLSISVHGHGRLLPTHLHIRERQTETKC